MTEKNPDLVELNKKSRRKSDLLNKLLQDDEILQAAATELVQEINWADASTSEEEKYAIFRRSRSLLSIALSIATFQQRYITEKHRNLRTSASQSKRAKNFRILIDGVPLRERISHEISRPERRNEKPNELWPHVVTMIRDHADEIEERWDGNTPENLSITFEHDLHRQLHQNKDRNKERPIKPHRLTYARFRTIVRELRKEEC